MSPVMFYPLRVVESPMLRKIRDLIFGMPAEYHVEILDAPYVESASAIYRPWHRDYELIFLFTDPIGANNSINQVQFRRESMGRIVRKRDLGSGEQTVSFFTSPEGPFDFSLVFLAQDISIHSENLFSLRRIEQEQS